MTIDIKKLAEELYESALTEPKQAFMKNLQYMCLAVRNEAVEECAVEIEQGAREYDNNLGRPSPNAMETRNALFDVAEMIRSLKSQTTDGK